MSTADETRPAKKQRQLITMLFREYPFFREVPNNRRKVYCTICKQDLLAVCMKRSQIHIESKHHQKHLHDNESKDNESRKFAQKWLQDIPFESW